MPFFCTDLGVTNELVWKGIQRNNQWTLSPRMFKHSRFLRSNLQRAYTENRPLVKVQDSRVRPLFSVLFVFIYSFQAIDKGLSVLLFFFESSFGSRASPKGGRLESIQLIRLEGHIFATTSSLWLNTWESVKFAR